MSRDLNVKAQENLKIYFCGKIHFVLGLLARDTANHSYIQNTPLTLALNPWDNDIIVKCPKTPP